MRVLFVILLFVTTLSVYPQKVWIDDYNVIWNSQSNDSMESLPCSGD